jgi:hypothetical protein
MFRLTHRGFARSSLVTGAAAVMAMSGGVGPDAKLAPICAWVACGDWAGADAACQGIALWMTCNGDGCEDGNNVIGCQ